MRILPIRDVGAAYREIVPAMWQARSVEVSGGKDRWVAPDSTVLRLASLAT